MYAGKVVEEASQLKSRNPHPYTVGLYKSTPRIDRPRSKIQAIEGSVPEFIQAIPGCCFNPRCPYAEEICEKEEPFLLGTDHKVACHFSLGASSDGGGVIIIALQEERVEHFDSRAAIDEQPLLEVVDLRAFSGTEGFSKVLTTYRQLMGYLLM